ncbi:hypothetical protein HOD96_03680 [Candidatus Falkowbacteria bacterium]|nr:hypothetical protein [Candidatus Falkowbacteria bacterium]MBT4433030.1 hypothetical protein [Candidatus Falkowbacteria bacterium]
MPEIKRKQGETFESFFRRFTRAIQQSGKILQSRKIKYLTKDPSRNEQRKSALVKNKKRNEQDYLKKIGKIEEKSNYYNRR